MEYSDDEEPKPSVRLSQAQKLRKVIIELVDTERSYVKVNMNDIQKLFFRRKKKQTILKQKIESRGLVQTTWFSRQKLSRRGFDDAATNSREYSRIRATIVNHA